VQLRILIVAFLVIVQFMMELTFGRIFIAPSLIPFILVYLSENYESMWAVDGAFWSGLCLDLLLHQPPGSSSLALLAGLFAARAFSRISSGEGRGYLLSMTAIAVLVSDAIFMIVASRPLGSGFSPMLIIAFLRAALTVVTGVIILTLIEWITGIRSRKVAG